MGILNISGWRESLGSRRGKIDVPMLLITAVLVTFGSVMIFSASSVYAEQYHDDRYYFIVRHFLFLIFSVAVTFVTVRFCPTSFWKPFGKWLYWGSAFLLLLVVFVGVDLGSGAKRWLDFGLFTVQPSEFAKTGLLLMLAGFMADHQKEIRSLKKRGGSFIYGVAIPGGMIALLCGLVALEHHISGLMIMGMIGICVMFLGGTRLRWILSIGLLVVLAGCFLVAVSDYAQTRVETWLFIEKADPRGEAWQTLQGLMAIGSGGLFGRGLGGSLQKYGYISQPQNDFIFTVVCEELGFFGAAFVLFLFALFAVRGFYLARHSTDTFAALTIYGITFKVALQVILNVAVVTNSMPNTGISLPLFSYGGTSLLLQIFEIGILLSLSKDATNSKI